MNEKQAQAFALFDQYNAQSPETIEWQGNQYPSEVFYAQQLYDWVRKLDPQASEALLLASRCQHIGRWEIARSSYPEGRVGYLKWRSDLAKHHAEISSQLLAQAGYDETTIERVRQINLKQKVKTDPEVRTIENALCLVFLEFQYDDLIEKLGAEKMIDILRKTWAKMSEPGHQAALTLTYSTEGKRLIEEALQSE
ncbi:hypothetical protein BWI93_11780 [Siphonobacter sp. BAB-5385]|uniref:DUF4202 domain-containing protein n=1 Tax=unclassified Siphonobacter TaxID=2635712 RepID=UPI000B9DE135|nr:MULTISPECIES: DUF4202 domain-containing protein [unclassified Siphonobacter]OZI07935.1 hypothetical protein BWI93_11780 [Siphonobacter sp. BAB-5385]PMD91431.1 hypothetical protein BWI97_21635 [Siphonobacter sp. BAB-5405]